MSLLTFHLNLNHCKPLWYWQCSPVLHSWELGLCAPAVSKYGAFYRAPVGLISAEFFFRALPNTISDLMSSILHNISIKCHLSSRILECIAWPFSDSWAFIVLHCFEINSELFADLFVRHLFVEFMNTASCSSRSQSLQPQDLNMHT